ncbi:plasmid partition protein ParG [Ekhidna sp.]|uniref:plasmid partition protein ParG n=1 Tax=Ekhidna sp. TaxID=2608089 RepID=UPI003B5B1A18
MRFKEFLSERSSPKSGKYRTINVDSEIHYFFKQTANHYNVALADLIYNVLDNWKSEFQNQIKEDMIKNLDK